MQSPPLLRTLLAVFVPYFFATLASARVLDRVGPLLVGVATTAIVLTVVRAFDDGDREPVALLDAE